MIIRSLELKNIRSYLDEKVVFPEGSVLLSGDIGCGKTTVLLAIEFAIFGIVKGTVSGTGLLRHGKKEGYVKLNFELKDKKVEIMRALKRGSSSVQQSVGYIMINGVKTEGTANELKAKMLELIGYPEELITKSKSLIFRYTVYTPQEEMKHILYESKDERLDTLRKIFNIDRYKRIKDNTLGYMRELKLRKANLEGKISDLEDKKESLKTKKEEMKNIDKEIKKISVEEAKVKQSLDDKKKELKEAEAQVKKLMELKKEIALAENKKENLEKQDKENKEEAEELKKDISSLKKELEGVKEVKDFEEKIKKLKQDLEKVEDELDKVQEKEAENKHIKQNSEKIIKNISELDECPTCKQDVPVDHKKKIVEREQEKLEKTNRNLAKIGKIKEVHEKRKRELELELEKLREQDKELGATRVKFQNLKEKEAELVALEKKKQDFADETLELDKKLKEIATELEKHKEAEAKYGKEKEEYEKINEEYKNISVNLASQKTRKEGLEKQNAELEGEIKKKEEDKKKLAFLSELLNWLSKYFMNVVGVIEKQVLLKIHQEFSAYFVEWFNILMEEGTLNVRLDEDFTPIIEQNGYDTYIENLSGGEKTSLALAYRLALNKVINDFISTIKTNDLIILDEPTDGFSSEQLDKLRDVLEQLHIKQTIIVSHESKLESYVDSIVRIAKQDHVSHVL
ncbi:MAG: AAA family ATPase [archaeon]